MKMRIVCWIGLLVAVGAVTLASQQPGSNGVSPRALEQKSDSPCPTQKTPAGWKTYVNKEYRFCFSYPSSYAPIAEPWRQYKDDPQYSSRIRQEVEEGRELELRDTQHPDARLIVSVGTEAWDLQSLIKAAPTGGEDPPEPWKIGGQVFYYYGRGGGGVCYPDQFFYDLRGKPLSISFAGPCVDGKTPTAETKKIEEQLLLTLRTF